MTPSPPWCMTFGSNFSTTAGVLTSARRVFPVPGTRGTLADLRTSFPRPEMDWPSVFSGIWKMTVPNWMPLRIVYRGEEKYPRWRSPARGVARPRHDGNRQAGVRGPGNPLFVRDGPHAFG